MTKPSKPGKTPLAGAFPGARSDVLQLLKTAGAMTAGGIAARLRITREGARQQLELLEKDGWIARATRAAERRAGRPAVVFALTPAGDHLFPKHYDALALALMDTVTAQLGSTALLKLLTALTDQQVQQWESRLAGKPLLQRLRALKGIYFAGDPFTAVDKDQRGYVLTEHNCPYLTLAMHRPRLCSVTVSTLTRLLGVRVVREKRFQDGDQRCAFRVLADQPVNPRKFRFAFEASRG